MDESAECQLEGDEDECEYVSPKDNPEYECICQKHGWKHAKEFIRDVAALDQGEYLFYFEMPEEKHTDFAFCNTVLGIVLDANQGKKLSLGCERHPSQDGANHFMLFKLKADCNE